MKRQNDLDESAKFLGVLLSLIAVVMMILGLVMIL